VIRAVFFDVDQTLVDFDAAAVRAHTALFGEADGYRLWCELTPQFWPLFTDGTLTFDEMRAARMARYLELSGDRCRDGALMEKRRWALVEESFQTFDDVQPCLDQLRGQGLSLGVITNNESVHQRRKLVTVGLDDAFDAVVISGEVGIAKPDRAIFTLACERLDVPPAHALHVGDLLDTDARAAQAAGLTGVWLDRLGLDDGTAEVPVIGSLDALPELVGAVRPVPDQAPGVLRQ
jgi:putative hydrolase of the HAD superfamily